MNVPLPSRAVAQLACARVLALALALVASGTASSFGQTRPSRSYYVYVCAESDDQVALVR